MLRLSIVRSALGLITFRTYPDIRCEEYPHAQSQDKNSQRNRRCNNPCRSRDRNSCCRSTSSGSNERVGHRMLQIHSLKGRRCLDRSADCDDLSRELAHLLATTNQSQRLYDVGRGRKSPDCDQCRLHARWWLPEVVWADSAALHSRRSTPAFGLALRVSGVLSFKGVPLTARVSSVPERHLSW